MRLDTWILALLPFVFVSCSRSPCWKRCEIVSKCPPYSVARCLYPSTKSYPAIETEYLIREGKIHLFFNALDSILPYKELEFFYIADGVEYQGYGKVLEGNQRIAIDLASSEQIVLLLQKCKIEFILPNCRFCLPAKS